MRRSRELASIPNVAAISLDRPVHGTLERTSVTIGARWVAENLSVDGNRDRRRDDRLRRYGTARRPAHRTASCTSPTSSISSRGVRRLRTRHARRRHHRRQRIRFELARRRGIAPGANLVVLKALDGAATATSATSSRRSTTRSSSERSSTSGSSTCRWRPASTSPTPRSADARREARRRCGDRRRHRGGQPRARTLRAASQYGGITSPGNAPGC